MPRRHRSHSAEFKRQVVAEYLAGETFHTLSRRHDLSRNLIRIWVEKAEAGALDEDGAAAELLTAYEARIAALERLVGRRGSGLRVGWGAARGPCRAEAQADAGDRRERAPDPHSGGAVPRLQGPGR